MKRCLPSQFISYGTFRFGARKAHCTWFVEPPTFSAPAWYWYGRERLKLTLQSRIATSECFPIITIFPPWPPCVKIGTLPLMYILEKKASR